MLLYRLLFLLYAEDRDLLPVHRQALSTTMRCVPAAHRRGQAGVRKDDGDVSLVGRAEHLGPLSRTCPDIIDKGDASVGYPALQWRPVRHRWRQIAAVEGGRAFGDRRDGARRLMPCPIERSTAGERRYINYRDLSVQQLGSIYERLLEFEVVRDEAGVIADPPQYLFARKNTGSYYTPDELVAADPR